MEFLIEKLTNLATFVAVLGVIIFVHEFGHFITAKMFGIRVFVFSFGFGQRLLGFKWGDTDCRLSLIPLGGYVKLEGEADDKISEDTATQGDGRDFTARPRWQRIVVYLAGPFMNVVLTVGVLTGVYLHGADLPDFSDAPVIGLVEPGSPAEAAGLEAGDEITSVDGEAVKTWDQVLMAIAMRPDQRISIHVRHRGTEDKEVFVQSRWSERNVGDIGAHPLVLIGDVTPGQPAEAAGLRPGDVVLRMDGKPIHAFEEIPPMVQAASDRVLHVDVSRQGKTLSFDVTPRDGKIGIRGGRMVFKKYGLVRSLTEACRHTAELARQTLDMLHKLVTAHISPKAALSGPVEIFRASGEAMRGGMLQVMLLTALLSLSVGVLNLFPLPPLDGGHLAILVVEGVIRRDLSPQAKGWIMNTGAIVLLLLIAIVLYFDFTKQAWFQKLFGQ